MIQSTNLKCGQLFKPKIMLITSMLFSVRNRQTHKCEACSKWGLEKCKSRLCSSFVCIWCWCSRYTGLNLHGKISITIVKNGQHLDQCFCNNNNDNNNNNKNDNDNNTVIRN